MGAPHSLGGKLPYLRCGNNAGQCGTFTSTCRDEACAAMMRHRHSDIANLTSIPIRSTSTSGHAMQMPMIVKEILIGEGLSGLSSRFNAASSSFFGVGRVRHTKTIPAISNATATTPYTQSQIMFVLSMPVVKGKLSLGFRHHVTFGSLMGRLVAANRSWNLKVVMMLAKP